MRKTLQTARFTIVILQPGSEKVKHILSANRALTIVSAKRADCAEPPPLYTAVTKSNGPFAALFFLGIYALTLADIGLVILHWCALFRLSKYFRSITAEEMLRNADTTVPIPS